MSILEQQNHLEAEIEKLMAKFKSDRDRHKYLAIGLKIMSVTLAGIVTVLLGWKDLTTPGDTSVPVSLLFGNIALILGAVITLVSAYDAFFNPRILWIRETIVYVKLSDLKRDLDYAVAGAAKGELDSSTLEKFKASLVVIMDDSLKDWLRLRGENTKPIKH
jgi:hypothetical protein